MQSNVSALAIAAALAILGAQAQAQGTYPSRPVRLIVPLAAGGGMDTVARALSLKLTDQAGQTIIVDNRRGGGGRLEAQLTPHPPPAGRPTTQIDRPSRVQS